MHVRLLCLLVLSVFVTESSSALAQRVPTNTPTAPSGAWNRPVAPAATECTRSPSERAPTFRVEWWTPFNPRNQEHSRLLQAGARTQNIPLEGVSFNGVIDRMLQRRDIHAGASWPQTYTVYVRGHYTIPWNVACASDTAEPQTPRQIPEGTWVCSELFVTLREERMTGGITRLHRSIFFMTPNEPAWPQVLPISQQAQAHATPPPDEFGYGGLGAAPIGWGGGGTGEGTISTSPDFFPSINLGGFGRP